MMKKSKILAVLMAVLMIGVLFVGCVQTEEKGENDIKISFWRSGLGIEFFNQIVADFERDTGYNVIPEETSDAEAMKRSIELGLRYNNVDLYMFGSVEPSYYQYLEPLNDILTTPAYGESETIGSKYNTAVLEVLKASDNNYYHLSYGGGWAGITYNADIIDGVKYKVPNTTTELETLVMQLSGDGIVPFIHFQGGGYWFVVYDIWQAQYDGYDYYMNQFLTLTVFMLTSSTSPLMSYFSSMIQSPGRSMS